MTETSDFDLFVIGGGSGGVRAARFAADYGARVGLAESRYYGGTCVNVGCVPKKLLVYGAQFAEDLATARGYGWSFDTPGFDWPRLIAAKNEEIARLNGIYRQLLDGAGVQRFDGHARLLDPNTVEVAGRRLRARHILLATGGWPFKPDVPGAEHAITSNEAFFLDRLPRRVVVVGGGYIAVEFASIFHGMGAQTTLMYRGERFLRGFDDSLRVHLQEEFERSGPELRFNTDIARIEREPDGTLHLSLRDGSRLQTDCVFYATGRRAELDDLGLEHTAVRRDARGFVEVDAQYRTHEPSISAIGDIIGRVQLTPVALAEGMAVARRLFRPAEARPIDYSMIPTAVFSLPNIATVGLTEQQALDAGHALRLYETRFKPMRSSFAGHAGRTLMKLVVDAASDRVLGAHMVGPEAAEIIQGLAVALQAGATKQVFDDTLGIHPSSAEEFVTLRQPTREVPAR